MIYDYRALTSIYTNCPYRASVRVCLSALDSSNPPRFAGVRVVPTFIFQAKTEGVGGWG